MGLASELASNTAGKMKDATSTNKSKRQFSLRAAFMLTSASAVWVWIFKETTPLEMAVLGGIAIAAGLVGHVVYTKLLPWRVTVIAIVILIYNSLLGALLLLTSGAGNQSPSLLKFLFDFLVLPLEMMRHATSPRDIVFWLVVGLGTLVFTAAHSLRPCPPSAMITAMGIAIWYGVSIMIMANSG